MLQNVVGWGVHPLLPWLAFVVLGLFLGRYDLSDPSTRRRIAFVAVLAAVTAPLVAYALARTLADDAWVQSHAELVVGTLHAPSPLFVLAASGTSACGIALAHEVVARWPRAWLVRALAAAGQLSFTIYLLHALVGIGVLRWVFELEHDMALVPTLAGAAIFCVGVVPLAWLWRARFARGPVEWLMRRVTGATPPRVHPVDPLRRVGGIPAPAWALAGAGVGAFVALRLVGADLRWGCAQPTSLTGRAHGEMTLTCPRQAFVVAVRERADVTLETHSGLDLYLELHDPRASAGATRVGENDDGGEGLDAKLTTTVEPGVYVALVRPFRAAGGRFTLVRTDDAPSPDEPACNNDCRTSRDGECDDGGPDSLYDICELGSDCADCGPR